jgi:hypothetical protein
MAEQESEFDSKLLPVLREGVQVVQMIFFMKLKEYVRQKNPPCPREVQGKIVGAIINDIFGIVNPDREFREFAQENAVSIQEIIGEIPTAFTELLIPLTDALRTAVLCDYQEGFDNSPVLTKARERGLLLADRDLPLPHRFISLVRTLGSSFGIVLPPAADEEFDA